MERMQQQDWASASKEEKKEVDEKELKKMRD